MVRRTGRKEYRCGNIDMICYSSILVHLMKMVTFVIGLTRSFARYSGNKETPLISTIYPIPFRLSERDESCLDEEQQSKIAHQRLFVLCNNCTN